MRPGSWENNGDNGNYGTTMALMLLPFWTDGCIGSMEGLFFEASGTTPYHFLTTAAMSKQSSNPVRELRYDNNDAAVGVPTCRPRRQVRDGAHRRRPRRRPTAAARAALVADSGPWDIYEVAGLRHRRAAQRPAGRRRPAAPATSASATSSSARAGSSTTTSGPRCRPTTGPTDWQRIDVAVDRRRRADQRPGRPDTDKRSTSSCRRRRSSPWRCPRSRSSNVEIDEQSLSFDVDQIGVPVLVKVSYFPNWAGDGAEGPYRIGPNMMVVVPTSNDVEPDLRALAARLRHRMLLTLVGIGSVLRCGAQGRRRARRPRAPAPSRWRGAAGRRRDGSAPGRCRRMSDAASALPDDVDDRRDDVGAEPTTPT